ncbi:alpha/beta hydrolase [Paenibacillus agricola]|uniref:Alpha/beta fold hydrolase n=1 Tax=Paenibacillus agricola TaxID=2716264 RepID=A0ABX0J7E4_9BACL|nr:alpha/beta fold hydrolase [Paenibacillus agricola]NHN30763.1 alpha/beta fold hydrolase [Paenibacillus agricola]
MESRHCLMLHGFTGGPYELTPLAEHLTSLGEICHVPTLPGHESDLRSLGQTQWKEWIVAASDEASRLTTLYGEIDLVGFSMGGLLSAYIANRFPIRRLVLLNAAVYYFSPLRFVKDVVRRIRTDDWAHWSKVKRTPLKATQQFIALNKQMRPELPQIKVPTLIAQGGMDGIIHPKSAQYLYRQLQGEKQLEIFADARHLICLEPGAQDVFRSVERFLTK